MVSGNVIVRSENGVNTQISDNSNSSKQFLRHLIFSMKQFSLNKINFSKLMPFQDVDDWNRSR